MRHRVEITLPAPAASTACASVRSAVPRTGSSLHARPAPVSQPDKKTSGLRTGRPSSSWTSRRPSSAPSALPEERASSIRENMGLRTLSVACVATCTGRSCPNAARTADSVARRPMRVSALGIIDLKAATSPTLAGSSVGKGASPWPPVRAAVDMGCCRRAPSAAADGREVSA